MVKKSLQMVLVLSIVFVSLSLISCETVYVKVLPSVPTVMETVRVYGISTWTGENDPSKMKLTESASAADAQAITASLAKGMQFNYRFAANGEVAVEQYTQETWAQLNNFSVKYRDLVDAGDNKFLLSTADISLVYDIDEASYNEMKKGIGVETRVSLKPNELMSLNQVANIAVKQAVKKLYGEKQNDIEGSVWVIKVLPEFNVSGTLNKEETNRYNNKSGKYVPKNRGTMDFLVTLVIRKDYIPPNLTHFGLQTNVNEVVGVIAAKDADAMVLPSFTFDQPADNENAKEKAKRRAESFADYISRGFEYKGTNFGPRQDRKTVKLKDYSYTTQSMIAGDSRQLIVGKGIVKPKPFEKPIVNPTKITVKHSFPLYDQEYIEKVLDKLPDLLVVKAIKTYGAREGMGYFGNSFNWRVYINEKTGMLEFEISCDVYMHISQFEKND